jgi:hypothetical protein
MGRNSWPCSQTQDGTTQRLHQVRVCSFRSRASTSSYHQPFRSNLPTRARYPISVGFWSCPKTKRSKCIQQTGYTDFPDPASLIILAGRTWLEPDTMPPISWSSHHLHSKKMDCMSQSSDRNIVIHRASESLASKSLSVLEPCEMPNAEKEEVLTAAVTHRQAVNRQ